jgi:hypothetical protein
MGNSGYEKTEEEKFTTNESSGWTLSTPMQSTMIIGYL